MKTLKEVLEVVGEAVLCTLSFTDIMMVVFPRFKTVRIVDINHWLLVPLGGISSYFIRPF